MDNIQRKLIDFIKFALTERDSDISISSEEWPQLYKMLYRQGMAGILFPCINRLPSTSKPEQNLYENWKNNVLSMVALQIRQVQEVKNIISKLNSLDISIIVFKGLAISRLYEQPELRAMGDIDILIHDKDMKITQQLVESMGYIMEEEAEDHPMHRLYVKPRSIDIEIHNSLLVPGVLGKRKMQAWYDHIWLNYENISIEGMEFSVMAKEDELVNQILHLATHMIHGGSRMRHIYDIALITKLWGDDLDWSYIKTIIEQINITKFAELIFGICHHYFDLSWPDLTLISGIDHIDAFVKKFLDENNGTRGAIWTRIAWGYPYLCKSLISLPYVYVWEFLFQLKQNNWSFSESYLLANQNIKVFRDDIVSFRYLGLIG